LAVREIFATFAALFGRSPAGLDPENVALCGLKALTYFYLSYSINLKNLRKNVSEF